MTICAASVAVASFHLTFKPFNHSRAPPTLARPAAGVRYLDIWTEHITQPLHGSPVRNIGMRARTAYGLAAIWSKFSSGCGLRPLAVEPSRCRAWRPDPVRRTLNLVEQTIEREFAMRSLTWPSSAGTIRGCEPAGGLLERGPVWPIRHLESDIPRPSTPATAIRPGAMATVRPSCVGFGPSADNGRNARIRCHSFNIVWLGRFQSLKLSGLPG